MTHIFLSDVHFGAFNKEQNRELEHEILNLIDYCESHEIKIHILGDFFDYWMEFPDFTPSLGRKVLERFDSYNQAMGKNTTYITGNHDYWTVSHFEERGFNVEHEYLKLCLNDYNIFLCHGDGLSDEKFQLKRPLLHRFIRHPKFITIYKSILSGRTGLHLMKTFSSFTRDEHFIDEDRLNEWAKFILSQFDYDLIITGHDHIPRMETFPHGIYINTGAFFKYKTLLKYTKNEIELVTWNSGKKGFETYLKSALKQI